MRTSRPRAGPPHSRMGALSAAGASSRPSPPPASGSVRAPTCSSASRTAPTSPRSSRPARSRDSTPSPSRTEAPCPRPWPRARCPRSSCSPRTTTRPMARCASSTMSSRAQSRLTARIARRGAALPDVNVNFALAFFDRALRERLPLSPPLQKLRPRREAGTSDTKMPQPASPDLATTEPSAIESPDDDDGGP